MRFRNLIEEAVLEDKEEAAVQANFSTRMDIDKPEPSAEQAAPQGDPEPAGENCKNQVKVLEPRERYMKRRPS